MRPDHLCKVFFEGEFYNSVAHAFFAAKTPDATERRRIRKAPTHQEMLQIASYVQEPADWGLKKLALMEKLTRDKFRRDRDLREKLKATNMRSLVNVLQGSEGRLSGLADSL